MYYQIILNGFTYLICKTVVKTVIQVNLSQKLLFLHQLTHNMTTDCSWNYHEKYKRRTLAESLSALSFFDIFCRKIGHSADSIGHKTQRRTRA